MKIIKSESMYVHYVKTNEGRESEYLRLGQDQWFIRMGESLEPVFYPSSEKLEKAFKREE